LLQLFPPIPGFCNWLGVVCLSLLGFAQEINKRQSIVKALSQCKDLWDYQRLPQKITEQFDTKDVPILYDIAFDFEVPYAIRRQAVWLAANLNPGQQEIDRIVKYITTHLPSYDSNRGDDKIYIDLKNSILLLYQITANDKYLLEPFRTLYEDNACDNRCKMTIIRLLRETDSIHNISLYKNILNDRGIDFSIKAFAVFGMAQSDSLESLPYLREMVNYLFDKELKRGRPPVFIWEAQNMLRMLGAKHYEASKEIQKVISNLCTLDVKNYGPALTIYANVHDLFSIFWVSGCF
jgi:hypothetical protein